MINPIFRSKKFYLLAVLALVIITAVAAALRHTTLRVPQLTLATPQNNAVAVSLESQPTLSFDQEIIVSDFTLSSQPQHNWTLAQRDSTTIQATSSISLQPQTKYTFSLSWRGHSLPDYSFTTMSSQTDPLLIQNQKDELARDYPLGQSTPHNTPLYRVVYSAPMTLEITIKNPSIGSAEAIADAKEWVRSLSGDVEAHKYVIAPPSPAP